MRTRRGTTAMRSACAALALAAVLAIAAPARAEEQVASAPVAEAVVGDPGEIRDYWTARRMRAAEPAGLGLAAQRSGHRGAATSDGAGAVRRPGAGAGLARRGRRQRRQRSLSRARARQGLLHDPGRNAAGRLSLLGHGRGLQRAHARLDGRPLRQRRPVRWRLRHQLDLRPRLSQRRAAVRHLAGARAVHHRGLGPRRQHPPGPGRRAARPRRAGARDRGRARRSRDRVQRVADAEHHGLRLSGAREPAVPAAALRLRRPAAVVVRFADHRRRTTRPARARRRCRSTAT